MKRKNPESRIQNSEFRREEGISEALYF